MNRLARYVAGRSAEDAVARHYETLGFQTVMARFRARSGEIDLIMRGDDGLVFVEVKSASDFASAAGRLTVRQFQRVWHAAEEFLAREPLGSLTPSRLDAALVDRLGRVEVIENAYMA